MDIREYAAWLKNELGVNIDHNEVSKRLKKLWVLLAGNNVPMPKAFFQDMFNTLSTMDKLLLADVMALSARESTGSSGGNVDMGTANPLMDGIASPGDIEEYASINHRHPTDTSRAEAALVALLKSAHDNLSNEYTITKSTVASQGTAISNVQSDITGIKTNVSGAQSDITEIKSDITGIKTNATGIQSDVGEVKSDITGIKADLAQTDTKINNLETRIDSVDELIPNQATDSNQLADKDFVNSSISNMAARYLTPTVTGDSAWTSLSQLSAGENGEWFNHGQSVTPTIHDYAIVIDSKTFRYAFDGNQWNLQYIVNDAPLNQAQMEALNSGATATIIDSIAGIKTGVADHINNKSNPHNVTAGQAGAIKSGASQEAGLFRYSNSSNGLVSVTADAACKNLGLGGSTDITKLLDKTTFNNYTANHQIADDYISGMHADVAALFDKFNFIDTRLTGNNREKTPKEYMDIYNLGNQRQDKRWGFVREFINGSVMGLDLPWTYLESRCGWEGHTIHQTAYGNNPGGQTYLIYTRQSISEDTWSAWSILNPHITGVSKYDGSVYPDWPVGNSGLIVQPREKYITLTGKPNWNGCLVITYGKLGATAWAISDPIKTISMWINGNGSFQSNTPIGSGEYINKFDLTIGEIDSEMWHITCMVTGMSAYTFDAVRIL